MAKVTAPLFSFGARGQLGEALVYFPWKGLDCVRTYVVPANPNTAAQQTQRGYLEGAVDDWHDVGLDAEDVTAWNRHAATQPKPMSGFNSFVKAHVNLQIATETPNMGYNGSIVDDDDDTFSGAITEDGTADAADMIWGTSPTSLINTEAGTGGPGTWVFTPTEAVSGQRIYARFVIKLSAAVVGYSGIYVVNVA